jgi:hypothetical protein
MHLLKSERDVSLFKNDEDIFENDMFWENIFCKNIENDLESNMSDWFKEE